MALLTFQILVNVTARRGPTQFRMQVELVLQQNNTQTFWISGKERSFVAQRIQQPPKNHRWETIDFPQYKHTTIDERRILYLLIFNAIDKKLEELEVI